MLTQTVNATRFFCCGSRDAQLVPGIISKTSLQDMEYGESNGHVVDDVRMWPQKWRTWPRYIGSNRLLYGTGETPCPYEHYFALQGALCLPDNLHCVGGDVKPCSIEYYVYFGTNTKNSHFLSLTYRSAKGHHRAYKAAEDVVACIFAVPTKCNHTTWEISMSFC